MIKKAIHKIFAAVFAAAVLSSMAVTAFASSSAAHTSSKTSSYTSSRREPSYSSSYYRPDSSSSYGYMSNSNSSSSSSSSYNAPIYGDNSASSLSDSKDDDYSWVMDYLNKNAVLDDSQNAVLADQDLIDFTTKGMYTISTKNGNVFYLIIDSQTHEVYFLNKVDDRDLYDLTASNAGVEISKSNVTTISEAESHIADVQTSTRNGSGLGTIIVIFGAALVVAIIIILKRRGFSLTSARRQHRKFVDDDFDDDDNDE